MINRIKQDQLMFRKQKLSTSSKFLSTLIADCVAVGKKNHRDPTDDECIAVIKSFLKKANETLKVNDNSTTQAEITLLESYLPQQLSTHELRDKLSKLFESAHNSGDELNMGKIMKHFKQNYNGQYDGKTLSKMAMGFLK